jgi:hypothetical protein
MGDYSATAAASALKNLVLRYLNPAAAPAFAVPAKKAARSADIAIHLPLLPHKTTIKNRAGASNDA